MFVICLTKYKHFGRVLLDIFGSFLGAQASIPAPNVPLIWHWMETWVCQICEIFMKTNVQNFSQSTIKALEWREWHCSGVFIFNFRGFSIEDPVKHLRWSFLSVQRRKAQIFNWVLNTLLKLDSAGLLEDFLQEQNYPNISKIHFENTTQTIWCLRLSRIRKTLTTLLNSFLHYKPRQNIWSKIEKSSKIEQDKKSLISPFESFFN